MTGAMDDPTRQFLHDRARHRCEYCHLPQAGHEEAFSIDHVIARKHRGPDAAANLALCCLRCNLFKGTDLSSIDTADGAIVPLFNPRTDEWSVHFRWNGPLIVGVSASGRATVALLRFNAPERVRLRQALLLERILRLD